MTNVVVLIIAIYVYVALSRQISARVTTDAEPGRMLGLPEALVAGFLVFIFLLGVLGATSGQPAAVDTRVLLETLLVTLAIVLFIVALLTFRGFDLNALAGFSKISFLRAISTGIILLIAAYPLIAVSEMISQNIIGGGSSKQSIVELFGSSDTIGQRVMIIVFAVAIAPVLEEFLFRFFLYSVLRRYFGRFFGVAFNSLLFAAVHTHLPSFAPLFVFGICLTVAFEWSGSILVSMTMHSLFNALSLTALAFPEFLSQ
ncbi:MAG: type II CAAX endopeptidase family protein [Verrucomicrobiota bacterium]